MTRLVETLPVETAGIWKAKDNQEIDALIAERMKELEVLTEEMKSSLEAIKKKSAEIEETKKQLGEIESKLGLAPTSVD